MAKCAIDSLKSGFDPVNKLHYPEGFFPACGLAAAGFDLSEDFICLSSALWSSGCSLFRFSCRSLFSGFTVFQQERLQKCLSVRGLKVHPLFLVYDLRSLQDQGPVHLHLNIFSRRP